MHPEPHDELRTASFRDLDTTTLYAILRLRSTVFVVEQACAYADIDGRDTEPGTRHVWFERDGEIRAYLRILREDGCERVGRVVTAEPARGAGLAGRLLAAALEIIGNRPSVLDAQAHLTGFYARHGYQPAGPEYLEDGIPHVPMLRATAEPARAERPTAERATAERPTTERPTTERPTTGRPTTGRATAEPRPVR